MKSALKFYELHALNDGLLLEGVDADHGVEPWRSDGTEAGTAIAQDIVPGVAGSYPHEFTALGDRVLFLAFDEASGEEPWVAHTSLLLHRPALAVRDLEDEVSSLHLRTGIETGLKAKLVSASRALANGRDVAAIVALEDFVNHVDVLTPGKIPEESAADLVEFAEDIVTLLQSSGGIQP